MNLSELSPLWEQTSGQDQASRTPEELQQLLNQRTLSIQDRIKRGNRRVLFFAVLGLLAGVGILALASDGFQEPGAMQALSKLLLLQTSVVAFFWMIKRSLRFEQHSDSLGIQLHHMIKQMRIRMWGEMSFFFLLLPALMLLLAAWNGSLGKMLLNLHEQPILGLSFVGFAIMGGLIWNRYQRPIRELEENLHAWEELG